MPWLAIWPGAAGATVAITAIDYAFPFYLGHISTIARVGTTLVFLVIVLIWFYAHALIILCAAIVNAMRYELHETGELAIRADPARTLAGAGLTRLSVALSSSSPVAASGLC